MSDNSRDIEKVAHSHGEVVGDFSPSITPVGKPMRRKFASAGPTGLFAFGSSSLLLALYNVNARGIHTPNVIVGMAAFSAGLVQLLAGMWEFPNGNLFGATAFSCYASFWMSYALIFIPGSGILAAYDGREDELNNALGLYLMVWFVITVIFIAPIVRRSVGFTYLLTTLALAILMLAIAQWSTTLKAPLSKAGGVFGIMNGFGAFYMGLAELMAEEETALFRLPC